MYGFTVTLIYLAAIATAVHAARRELGRPAAQEPALYLAAAALLLHALWIAGAIRTQAGVALALADSASLAGWFIGLGGTLSLLARNFRGVAAALLGLATLLAAGTGSLPQLNEVNTLSWPLAVHVVLAMGAAGMFAIAAVLVCLLAWQDGALRQRREIRALSFLPPVTDMERALFTALGTGFAALSVAILAGLLFVTNLFAQHLIHKTSLALLAWLIFAVLLLGRWRFGWRGRIAARYTLAGFVVLALAYFGSKFVLEVLLGRHWG